MDAAIFTARRNTLYVVVRQIDNDYVLLANGDTKSIDMPKKKKIKHLIILENRDLFISLFLRYAYFLELIK